MQGQRNGSCLRAFCLPHWGNEAARHSAKGESRWSRIEATYLVKEPWLGTWLGWLLPHGGRRTAKRQVSTWRVAALLFLIKWRDRRGKSPPKRLLGVFWGRWCRGWRHGYASRPPLASAFTSSMLRSAWAVASFHVNSSPMLPCQHLWRRGVTGCQVEPLQ
ncbi:hypothetical protein VTK26DRAFT_9045 [Humicola hyalothermophila]